jgi:hypothetical protein
MWQMFADMSNAVKKDKIPGYLTTMAYGQYRYVPEVNIPDNLLVMLATKGPWNEGNPAVRDSEMALMKSWTEKLDSKIWLWTYPGKYHGKGLNIPHTTPRATAAFVKRSKPYIFGVFFESASDRAIYNYLYHYTFGKLLWNTETNIDDLLAEHATVMFGPAAKPMQEFFESVERNWLKIASKSLMGDSGPDVLWPTDLELWNNIYSEKEIARMNALREQLVKGLLSLGIDVKQPAGACAPHIVNLTLPSIKSEVMLHFLDARGICVSAGSACSTRSRHISSALLAFGASEREADCSLRVSLCADNTAEEVDALLEALSQGLSSLIRIR